jgi:hypothetical protein
VGQYLGQLRLDTPEQVAALNVLYEQLWLYYYFFQQVLHLIEKKLEGDKVVRKWDEAKMPYERLLASGGSAHSSRSACNGSYEQTNPLQLREAIYRQLAALWQSATLQLCSAA